MIRRAIGSVAVTAAALLLSGCGGPADLPTGPGTAPQSDFPLFETTDLVDTTTAYQVRIHRRSDDAGGARALRAAELASSVPPGTSPDAIDVWGVQRSGDVPFPRAICPPAVAYYVATTKALQAGDFSRIGEPVPGTAFLYEASARLFTSYDVEGIHYQNVYVVTIGLDWREGSEYSGRGYARTLIAVYTPQGDRRSLSDRGFFYTYIS